MPISREDEAKTSKQAIRNFPTARGWGVKTLRNNSNPQCKTVG